MSGYEALQAVVNGKRWFVTNEIQEAAKLALELLQASEDVINSDDKLIKLLEGRIERQERNCSNLLLAAQAEITELRQHLKDSHRRVENMDFILNEKDQRIEELEEQLETASARAYDAESRLSDIQVILNRTPVEDEDLPF